MRGFALRGAVAATCSAVAVGLLVAPASAATATLSPAFGPIGSHVTITGSGFTGATHVRFTSAVEATSFTVPDDQHVNAVVPAGAATGPVAVAEGISCVVTRETLTAITKDRALDERGCLEAFRIHRPSVEILARTKYLERAADIEGGVVLSAADVPV